MLLRHVPLHEYCMPCLNYSPTGMCAECPYIVFISKGKQTTSALKVCYVVLGKTREISFEQTKWTNSLCFHDWTNWPYSDRQGLPPWCAKIKGRLTATQSAENVLNSAHTRIYILFLGGTHFRWLEYISLLVWFTAVQCSASCQQYMLTSWRSSVPHTTPHQKTPTITLNDNTISYGLTLFTFGRPCWFSTFKQCSVDLIFPWQQLVYEINVPVFGSLPHLCCRHQ